MTLNVRLHNLDELDARVDVWTDEAMDLFAERLADRIDRTAGNEAQFNAAWPVFTGWSASGFFWREGAGDRRELHNVAPYAAEVERGYRFAESGHPSRIAERAGINLRADPMGNRSIERIAAQFANRGPRGEHRPGLHDHQAQPINVTAAALFSHRYARVGPYPGDEVVLDFTTLLGATRLGARGPRA